jgi:hypothetical protein
MPASQCKGSARLSWCRGVGSSRPVIESVPPVSDYSGPHAVACRPHRCLPHFLVVCPLSSSHSSPARYTANSPHENRTTSAPTTAPPCNTREMAWLHDPWWSCATRRCTIREVFHPQPMPAPRCECTCWKTRLEREKPKRPARGAYPVLYSTSQEEVCARLSQEAPLGRVHRASWD